jgi:hypothetical protein
MPNEGEPVPTRLRVVSDSTKQGDSKKINTSSSAEGKSIPLTSSGITIAKSGFTAHTKESKDYADKITEARHGADPMATDHHTELFDAKLQTIEQKLVTLETKIDGKLDLIVEKFSGLNTRIEDVHTRIGDVWNVMVGGFILLVISVLVLVFQNFMVKPAAPPAPMQFYYQLPPAPVSGPAKAH